MSAYVLDNGQRVYPAFLLNSESGGGIVTPPASFRLDDGTAVTGIVLIDEAGEIVAAPGGGQQPYVQVNGPPDSSSTPAYPAANAALFYRVRVSREVTVTNISYYIGAASGNVDVGIYTSSDSGATLTRLGSSGSVAAAGATTMQTVALTAPVTLEPGTDYWLAMAADNTTLTVFRKSVPQPAYAINSLGLLKASSFPLPASVSSLSGANAAIWLITS